MLLYEKTLFRLWRPDRLGVDKQMLLAVIQQEDARFPAFAPGEIHQAALVIGSERNLTDFASENEPSEVFFEMIKTDLISFSHYLATFNADELNAVREAGAKADLFLEATIDQDQIEFSVPVELITAMNRLRLALTLVSND